MHVRWPQLPEQDAHAAKKGEPRGSLLVLALPRVEHRLCVPAGLSACMQLGSSLHLPLPASSGCWQPLGNCPQSSPVPIPLGGDKQVSGGLLTCPRIPEPSLPSMPAGPHTSRPSTLGSLLHSPQPGAQAQPSPGSTSQAAQAGPTGHAAAPPSPSQAHQLPLLPSPLQSPSGGQGPRPLSATLHSAAPPPVVTIKPSVPVQQPGTPFSSLASLAQAYQPHAPAQVCAVQQQQEGVRQNTGIGGCGIVPALGQAMGVLCSIPGAIRG